MTRAEWDALTLLERRRFFIREIWSPFVFHGRAEFEFDGKRYIITNEQEAISIPGDSLFEAEEP